MTIIPTTRAHRAIPTPQVRTLRAFAFDPSCNRNYGNYMSIRVPFEERLTPGPVGHYVAVVDYDAVNKCYYEPVDLNERPILANGGLDPSEADPRFHQQMVYAVASETIARFKLALGRDIHWRLGGGRAADDSLAGRLLLLPHGLQEANAYYDPELHAILFGYFTAPDDASGSHLPGQTVFTCLAHDIIAHEMTHAILDGIRPLYMEPSNPDVAAFHEAIADIVALFQHFSMKDAVIQALRRTSGNFFLPHLGPEVGPTGRRPMLAAQLTADNPLVGLANQFGDGIGLHGPLRSAIGTPPEPTALEGATEPHDRGAILVAAVFDAFFSVFLRRTSDLWRIAGLSRDQARDLDLHPDLLARLAGEAAKTAGHFETLCIRALDYAPVVDITFGDYLRALVTADRDLVRDDDLAYRAALIDAFRLRGIRPESVRSYSEESLCWSPPATPLAVPGLTVVTPGTPAGRKREVQAENARRLFAFAKANAAELGFADTRNISVPSFHGVHRVGPDGQLLVEMVAQVVEKGADNDKAGEPHVFGGASLIFNIDGSVRYSITKSLKKRRERQAAYRRDLWQRGSAGAYASFRNEPLSFRALHGGL